MILSALKQHTYNMNPVQEGTFKSYLDESILENILLDDDQRTSLLDGKREAEATWRGVNKCEWFVGETVVHEAQKVLLLAPLSDRGTGSALIGVLTVTTFKLSFASPNLDNEGSHTFQQNLLLKPNEICLSAIEAVYQIGDKSKKKLIPGQSVSGKVKELLIICKNMRSMSFSFKHSDKDSGKQIANCLIHHAFPKRAQLLFAYDFRDADLERVQSRETHLFVDRDDWQRELERCKCPNWRVSDVNRHYLVSCHLPEYVVVPHDLLNDDINKGAQYFRNYGFPIWVWGTPYAALVRMPELLPGVTNHQHENTFIAKIHKTHPMKVAPEIFELSKDCPSPKDVQSSYVKLRTLCVPDTARLFKEQDVKFFGLLDGTKWLSHVSMCLAKASEAAKCLMAHRTVVLQEDAGQDLNCVVSSLVQLILDPHCRTRRGFQSLIQKEWVSLGHAFLFRLGHVLDADVEPAYVFLLFLDCVWQLLQQCPNAFQFSETYLTTLWDSSHISIFDTFLFNNQHDRYMAINNEKLILRSVWDWQEQFLESDLVLFNNPLYDKEFRKQLTIRVGIPFLDVWKQCYFRWLPTLEIRNGGKPQIDICNRFLAEDIALLRHRLKHDRNGLHITSKTKDDKLAILKSISSFYPFSYRSVSVSETFHNDLLLPGDSVDTQSILNLTND